MTPNFNGVADSLCFEPTRRQANALISHTANTRAEADSKCRIIVDV